MKKKGVKYNHDENKNSTKQCKSDNVHHKSEKCAACLKRFFFHSTYMHVMVLKRGLKGVAAVSRIAKQSSELEA